MKILAALGLSVALLTSSVGAARADSQFPPASFAVCQADFDSPFEYAGDGDAATVAKLASVCEASAKEALAYTEHAVPDAQKKVVAAFAMLAAAVLADGNPLNQEDRAFHDASQAINLFKIAELTASSDAKAQIDAIIEIIENNLPRLAPKT